MNLSLTLMHDVVLVAMLVLFVIAVAVIIERMIYFSWISRARVRLEAALAKGPKALEAELARKTVGPHARMVQMVDELKQADPERFDLKVQAAYLSLQGGVKRLLWVVDTAITMSPLLGLLGTILGIIDTFSALAAQGVSDPAAVSRGIGTALFATAAGIGIATFCLAFNNWFNERVERVNEELKVLALNYAATH